MEKKIHIAFTENKLETYIKIPLVMGDKNAYKLIMNLEKYPDAKYVFIYAQRSDGKTYYDSFEISGNTAEYTLKQSVYSVLGEVTIRIVLKDTGETSLTTAILRFNAVEGAYHENMAEDMGSLEEFLLSAKNKADKSETLSGYGITDAYTKAEIDEMMENMGNSGDTYTKAEIDQMVSGVYRFCGSTTVSTAYYQIMASPKRAGDVYHIAKGGMVLQGANVWIPISEVLSYGGIPCIRIPRTEYDNILAITIVDPDCYIEIGKSKGMGQSVASITNVKISEMDDTSMILAFDFCSDSPIKDLNNIDTSTCGIAYMDHNFTVESGDNVAWTGDYWDKL